MKPPAGDDQPGALPFDPTVGPTPTSWGTEETVDGHLATTEDLIPPLPRIALHGDTPRPAYRLGEVLGRGGMAVVYAAEHHTLGRTVAVKTLRASLTGPAPTVALINEARIAGSLEHPNIVPVHDLGLDSQGRPHLVMKRIDGEPLSVLLRRPDDAIWQRWPGDRTQRVLQVLLRVADALSAAHSAGIIHRDVKPSNIVLGPVGEVYLLDWGLALRLGPKGIAYASVGGTPGYMAPEMAEATRALDARTDVFLLGATLYDALVGRPPGAGHGSVPDIAALELPATLPRMLRRIIRTAMAGDPAERYPGVDALRAALVVFLERRGALKLAAEADRVRVARDTLRGSPAALDPHASRAIDHLTAEARFGYQAALKAWPACPSARDGLGELIRGSIVDDLARGDTASARRALAELPEPDLELARAVAAAETQAAAERAELEDARRVREGLDVEAGGEMRRFWLPVVLLFAVGGPIQIGLLRLLGQLDADEIVLGRGLLPIALAGAILFRLRRTPGAGPGAIFNRRMLRLITIVMTALGIIWTYAALAGLAVVDAVFFGLLAIAMTFAAATATLDRRLAVPTAACGVGMMAVHLWPPGAELIHGACLGAGLVYMEQALRRTDRGRGGAAPGSPSSGSAGAGPRQPLPETDD